MHAEILRSKVKKKNERKSLTLEKQERYRRGRETIINILCYYFLYYLIQRKEKKMMERCTLHLQTQKRFLKFGKKGDMRILEEKEPEEGIIRRIKRI